MPEEQQKLLYMLWLSELILISKCVHLSVIFVVFLSKLIVVRSLG